MGMPSSKVTAERFKGPTGGRSPGRARPSAQVHVWRPLSEQVVSGNRSPARTRPPVQSSVPVVGFPSACRPFLPPGSDGDVYLPVGAHSPYQSAGALVPAMQPDAVPPQEPLSYGAVGSPPAAVPATSSSSLEGFQGTGSAAYPQPPTSSASCSAVVAQGVSMEVQPPNQSSGTAGEGDDDMDLYGLPGQSDLELLEPDSPPQKAKGQLTAEERIAYHELQFVEHLGSGEFGQVFRGFYRGREVAIKQLYWDNSVLPEVIIEDLTREIESFRHLQHKRLVGFLGACLEIPNLCLVTEYMPGGSLHHLLHVRKLQLPLLHCINMCLQLADGVMYLHAQTPCVVHRDLKSLNVVLDMNLNLKLCDFGLTESMDRTHITKKNNGGSPRYMAPELFDSKSKITEKVDIWSMGCIFTEIFGGPLPYEGINTLADLTREMLVHRRTPAIHPDVPDAIQSIIRSCYNFDYRLRPSARQVFDHLRDVKRRLRVQGLL